MRTAKLFRWIWRVNAVVIFLVALAALLAIGWEVVDDLLNDRRRMRAATPVVQQDPQKRPLVLGAFQIFERSGAIRARLERHGGGGMGSSAGTTAHNILFVDPATGAGKWLLPAHARLIREQHDAGDFENPLATAVHVTAEDSDSGEILVFDPGGREIVTAPAHASELEGIVVTGPATFAVFFRRGTTYHMAQFAMTPLRKTGETELRIPVLP